MKNRLNLLGGLTVKEFLSDHLQKNGRCWCKGVNHHLSAGTKLLKLFYFIPHTGMDDLMVSFAAKGRSRTQHSYRFYL